MDNRTFSLLGFDRIIGIIKSKTQTVFGRELVQQLSPLSNITEIETEFDLVEECLRIPDEISIYNVLDLRQYLPMNVENTVLSPTTLRDALKTLETLRKTKEFFTKRKDSNPKLFELIKDIKINEQLEKAISNAIDEFGEIKTDASPTLRKIRSEITKKRKEIIGKLEKIIKDKSDYLQDSNFAIRHSRFCLPLKVEAQKKINGILHEYSPAGKTVFIEPLDLVDDQNDFAKLIDEEKSEIQRILSNLSKVLFKMRDELLTNFSIIGKIDLLFAKRRFALQFNCTRPLISNDGLLRINRGIHPLLTQSKIDIVPLDITFPKKTNVILISGPNAGGKTVVLKTVGLFVLMYLSGIYLPAGLGTEIPYFEQVFADIGDEQSLDTNLSSFSAHILRIKEILDNANNKSLVLLDEIGSSTAPEEGSALAIAVLEVLRDKGAYCMATSHFNPLKAFVNDAVGMVNAAMEYTDRPTYHFSIGLPGTSSALEISKELGFPEELLKRAKNFLNQDWLKLSERLQLLASETEKTKKLNETMTKEKLELERIRSGYESRLKNFKSFENEQRQKILNESRRFLLEQRRNIENLVRHIKETNAERNAIIEAKKYIEEQLNNNDTIESQDLLTKKNTTNRVTFKIGESVYSKTFQKAGTVIETTKDNITVAFGSIKFELKYEDLEKITKDDESMTSLFDKNQHPIQANIESFEFEPFLSIRGQNKEEAIMSINKFLNDAIDNNIQEVSIIHGKRKGVLKDMIWELLKNDSRVGRLDFGELFEDGTGLTKVTLKKKSEND